MNQLQTKGIVLSRTDYGEADRIVTVLTPLQGKRSLMAKGVRKLKSKLAGGIELFSVSELSYIQGRGSIDTLTSARLLQHFGNIVQSIDRVQTGYELISMLHRATEDNPESDYFELLVSTFAALDDSKINLDLIRLWFPAQLLRYGGHTPNLKTDQSGKALVASSSYDFDFDTMSFMASERGAFTAQHIKFLRLVFSGNDPKVLSKIDTLLELLPVCMPLVRTMLQTYIQI